MLPHDTIYPMILTALLLGSIQCFFGYRLFKMVIGFVGFILGAVLAIAIINTFFPEKITVLVSGVLGGIMGTVMVLMLYHVGIFVIGAILGGIVGSFICALAGMSSAMWIIAVASIAAGLLALVVQKYMIIAATAYGGAWLLVTAFACFATGAKNIADIESILQASGNLLYIILPCWIMIGMCGWMVQLEHLKKATPVSNE